MAGAGWGLLLTLGLTLSAGALMSPGRSRAAGEPVLIPHRPVIASKAHALTSPFNERSDSSGHSRLLAGNLIHRRGRPRPGVASATVLTARRIDEGIKPLSATANAHATQRFTEWWRAIPAGFNSAAKLPLAAVVSFPPSYVTLDPAHTPALTACPDSLPGRGRAASRLNPFTIALYPRCSTRPHALPRFWVLGPSSVTDTRNSA